MHDNVSCSQSWKHNQVCIQFSVHELILCLFKPGSLCVNPAKNKKKTSHRIPYYQSTFLLCLFSFIYPKFYVLWFSDLIIPLGSWCGVLCLYSSTAKCFHCIMVSMCGNNKKPWIYSSGFVVVICTRKGLISTNIK